MTDDGIDGADREFLREVGRLRGECIEAWRYVRDVSSTSDTIVAISRSLAGLSATRTALAAGEVGRLSRLASNLEAVSPFLQVGPDVVRGYLVGAAFELGIVKSKFEKGGGSS